MTYNRSEVVWALERLIEGMKTGRFDKLLTLSDDERDIVRGCPLARSDRRSTYSAPRLLRKRTAPRG